MKFPRMPHLPWSRGGTFDDIRKSEVACFDNKKLVYTEKLDGECTVISKDNIHARSEDGYGKTWQTFMIRQCKSFQNDIPENMYVCGENLYAVHSIEYGSLSDYFYVFTIFFDNYVLSWEETEQWCDLLGVKTVPVIGYFDKLIQIPIPEKSSFGDVCEGYVVRNIDKFHIDNFSDNIAKVVRENHVQTNIHWAKNWKKAELKKGK